MSLQEIVGLTVHLKLSIKEGHGFGFLRNPMVIVAGTNGISLETEVVPPSPDPQFHIELVWETDKKTLRRVRASNTPIKVECFTIGLNNKRESIGSILLNIKSAQAVVGNSSKLVNEKWHRLIGVPMEAKALQPELLLSLTIQEPNVLTQPLSSRAQEGKEPTELPVRNSVTTDVNLLKPQLSPVHILPDSKQGYIQLGPENSCCDTFFISLSVRQTIEIELLFMLTNQEVANFDSTAISFQISFSLMNQSKRTKSFGCISGGKGFHVDDDVVFPLRTSLPVLHMYLQDNPCATVCLLYCEKEIAAAELHMRSLVPTNDVKSFSREFGGEASLTQNCIFVSASSGNIPVQGDFQPSIQVVTRLQLVTPPAGPQRLLPTVVNHLKNTSDMASTQICAVNQAVSEESLSRSASRQSQDTFVVTAYSGPVWVPVAPGIIQYHLEKSVKEKSISNGLVVKVVPISLEILAIPKPSRIRFLFECPNSSITTSKVTDLCIGNNMGPISVEGIHATVTADYLDCIQIHAFGVKEDSTKSNYIATAKINSAVLNQSKKTEVSVSCALQRPNSEQSLGCIYITLFMNDISEKLSIKEDTVRKAIPCQKISNLEYSLGEAHCSELLAEKGQKDIINQFHPKGENVDSQLIDEGKTQHLAQSQSVTKTLNETLKVTCKPEIQSVITHVMPLDSNTAYKIVEELEDWKEKQQEIFIAELKQKEIQHIAQITDEWESQNKTQNAELERKMTECKAMAESLSCAKQDLRDRLKTCVARELELRKAKDELDLHYNIKFQELTLAARRLDEGVKLKVALAESKSLKLEEMIKDLESENEGLRQQLHQKTSTGTSNDDNQMCGMSHIQVSQLLAQVDQLEGNLHRSLESKAYFKEQWGRAVREMNQAKLQFAQTSENKKCLENMLGAEEKELQNDQETLKKLRQDIAHLNL